jgi:aryl-alcohol dehydrogenase-like predicted oxidoreductase
MGARNAEQLKDSLRAADIELSPDLYAAICELTPTPPPATDRSEILFKD